MSLRCWNSAMLTSGRGYRYNERIAAARRN
jgi:hypothetical protein